MFLNSSLEHQYKIFIHDPDFYLTSLNPSGTPGKLKLLLFLIFWGDGMLKTTQDPQNDQQPNKKMVILGDQEGGGWAHPSTSGTLTGIELRIYNMIY